MNTENKLTKEQLETIQKDLQAQINNKAKELEDMIDKGKEYGVVTHLFYEKNNPTQGCTMVVQFGQLPIAS